MGKLLLLFVIVPLIEFVLLAKIGAIIGLANTVLMVVVTGMLGAWLFRLEGGRAWRKWQESLARGRTPEEGVLGGVLLLLGGALLITPGVITDAVGLLLLIPQTRQALAGWLLPRLTERFIKGARDGTIRVEVGSVGRGSPMWIGPEDIEPGREHDRVKVIDADFEVKRD